jgi:hypothetical protein
MKAFLEKPILSENIEKMAARFSWEIYAKAISKPWL